MDPAITMARMASLGFASLGFASLGFGSLGLGSLGLALPGLYYSPWLWRRYRMRQIHGEVRRQRALLLTYDDGPSSALTQPLLDLLRERAARATFFMLGCHAQQFSGIADRVLQEGHAIGCHSHQHLNAWKTLPWKSLADIDAGYRSLSRWIQPDGMFRPPYGKMTLPTCWSIHRRKAPVWWWTIDSGDTHDILPQTADVAEQLRTEGGGIVLMHDLDRTEARNRYVLELTASLLDVALQEGLNVTTLRELCPQ
jgi:peptidoglycan/xylan/chitin deacetylase (PgdA/CDA1 family)